MLGKTFDPRNQALKAYHLAATEKSDGQTAYRPAGFKLRDLVEVVVSLDQQALYAGEIAVAGCLARSPVLRELLVDLVRDVLQAWLPLGDREPLAGWLAEFKVNPQAERSLELSSGRVSVRGLAADRFGVVLHDPECRPCPECSRLNPSTAKSCACGHALVKRGWFGWARPG